MLVRLRFSRAAATSSKALNRGETRKLIETVFSAAMVVVVLYRGLPYMTAAACESTRWWAPRGFDHVLQQTRELQRPTGTGVLRLRVRAVFPKNRV